MANSFFASHEQMSTTQISNLVPNPALNVLFAASGTTVDITPSREDTVAVSTQGVSTAGVSTPLTRMKFSFSTAFAANVLVTSTNGRALFILYGVLDPVAQVWSMTASSVGSSNMGTFSIDGASGQVFVTLRDPSSLSLRVATFQ